MKKLAEKFTEWAKANGWNVKLADKARDLPESVTERYKFIPADWLEFIRCFEVCANGADNVWFDTGEYDEFEQISLEAAEGDEEWTNKIRAFWDNHIPVVISVAGYYHYYAVGVRTGEVFKGSEPEFEEVEIAAPSFTDFVEYIIGGKIVLN
ncbi:MAG: SMI1/KNR4 family protein [Ruminococcaceae bacterium]|nr:SMI1/KNR4 family protein [Oscillospiraceae bacterium]